MRNRTLKLQGLVFGGIMAALVLVCTLVPFLNIFMLIPLVLAYVRYGGRVAGLTAVVAVLFSFIFTGLTQTLYLIPMGILPGLAFGYGFRHKRKPIMIGLIATVVFFVGLAGTYSLTRVLLFDGRDPIEATMETPLVRQQFDRLFEQMETTVKEQPGLTDAQRQVQEKWIRDIRENPVKTVWASLPAGLFLISVFYSWLNYMLCRWILPRFGHEVPRPTPFGEFRLPAWLTWVFALLSMAMAYFGQQISITALPWWVQVLWNTVLPLQMVFVLAGLAVAYGFLRKKGLGKAAATAIPLGVLLFTGGAATQLYLVLAMWDTIFDFRGLGHGMLKRPEETP